MPKRRIALLVFALAVLWANVIPAVVSAADETKQGNTQGTNGPFVTNWYLWNGDVTRYGQGEAQYQITIAQSTQVYARWECQTRNGAIINFGSGYENRTVNVTAAAFQQASMIFVQGDGRCAYHLWQNSGAGVGFKILTGSILLWLSEFNGGGGNNGGGGALTPPPPGASSSPGASGFNSGAPSPTPPPDPNVTTDTCSLTLSNIQGGQCFTPTRTYLMNTVLDISIAVTSTGSGINNWGNTNMTGGAGYNGSFFTGWQCTWAANTTSGCSIHTATAWTFPDGWAGSGNWTGTAPARTGNIRGQLTADTYTGTSRTFTLTIIYTVISGPSWVSPSPSPSPSSSAGASAGSCTGGAVWTGTSCEFPPTSSWFTGGGALPPPLVQPTTGPFLGGGNGIQEPAPNTPNNNGIGECTADDGTYSKPGQAALQALPNTSFPGSINPLDYIPWVGNLVATVPITVSNAAQWTVNTGVDLVVPGECVATLVTDASDALMEKAPLSLYVEAREAFEGALGGAGSGSVPSATIAGVTLTLPLDDIAGEMSVWRSWAGAFVWLLGIVAVIRLIGGTLGVSNGGGGE